MIPKTDSEELDSLPLPSPPPSSLPPLSAPNSLPLILSQHHDNNDNLVLLHQLPEVIDQLCTELFASPDAPDHSPPTSMSVNGYQDIVSGPLTQYIDLSKKIGGDVAKHAETVERAFSAQLQYVTLASTSAQPPANRQQELLKPTSDQIAQIQEYREKNRTSPFFNHLSAISESIPALGWVCVVS